MLAPLNRVFQLRSRWGTTPLLVKGRDRKTAEKSGGFLFSK